MSELINNREYRQKILKELILELHDGKSVEDVRERFQELIKGVSTAEISQMEAQLIKEGMKVEEIQRLCDVHAAVFKGSIEEIHHPDQSPGHPIHTFKRENKAVQDLIDNQFRPNIDKYKNNEDIKFDLLDNINLLGDLDKHYSRKENLLFPYLEKYGITAPPQVMWGVDDEIREEIKACKKAVSEEKEARSKIAEMLEKLIVRIEEMIYKEEHILFPMCMDTLTEDEWLTIEEESAEIGYCITEPAGKWKPLRVNVEDKEEEKIGEEEDKGYIKFDTGILKVNEISAIFNSLPFDITFVDKDGIVKYFSNSSERIFARTKAVIGRTVENCHPPASVHVVEQVVENLRSGKKDYEDFWIKMGPKYVLIRYFAVRDEKGEFLGTLEVTQNIQPIQEIRGEKRLLD
ncbi:MAG TPA: PAS domain S-box protein [Clostridium sp.]|jgi:PAS domain S-box-containing protein|nr:DUF438 domain-containing protein [Clostridia bacterium]HCW03237.1 PAS domain S-box protein [Clostridium sp.]